VIAAIAYEVIMKCSKIQMEGLLMPLAEAMFLFSDLKVLLSAFKRGSKS